MLRNGKQDKALGAGMIEQNHKNRDYSQKVEIWFSIWLIYRFFVHKIILSGYMKGRKW